MGVDYAAVSGYGFVLDPEEDDILGIATRAGYKSPYDDGDDDPYELIEWLCHQYGVQFVTGGSAYSDEVVYLIGDVESTDVFGLEEVTSLKVLSDSIITESKLNKMLSDLGIQKKIAHYSGLYVY